MLAAAVVSVGPAGAAETPTTRFADVDPTAFFGPAAEWGRDAGVVNGVIDECFVPERAATRGEVAAMLQRLLAPSATATDHGFTDVVAGWQQVPVTWMVGQEITNGRTPTTFAPNEIASRAMVSAFLWRAEGRPTVDSIDNAFDDVIADWQRDAVEWMWQRGITTGRSATSFAPDEPVTRAELLTFLWRWQGEPAPPTDLTDPEPIDCRVATGTCANPFGPAAVAAIDELAAGRRVTASVHDHRTGCRYDLHAGLVLTTASVIKAQVLAGVLLAAQDGGGPVSASDNGRIELMMRFSHNSPPTSQLYVRVGGTPGMEALDRGFGLTATGHTSRYGATTSTAQDRTRLIEQLLVGGGPLDASHVAQAWNWMAGVSVGQSWGLSAGLPADHEVALKNGFYPLSGRGWRIGTSGVVRTPDGGTYAATVMTDGNGTESDGIALVEAVARLINDALALGEPAPRPYEALRCVQASRGQSWSSLGSALGVTDLTALRKVNGGESGPLSGQRVCAPPEA